MLKKFFPTSTLILTMMTLFLIDSSFEQESWKSLVGESDDEPSWFAKTAFKGTRDPVFAVQDPEILAPPCFDDYCPAVAIPKPTPPPPTPQITTFKMCGKAEKVDKHHFASAWWRGWCFLEEFLPCSRYRFGRKLYIADKNALNDIMQLLKQWELDAELNFGSKAEKNAEIGQWYIEGRDKNGKCRVFDWNTESTSYAECDKENIRFLCQYPVCRDRQSQYECEHLAKLGDCVNNRAWMEDNCQNSCVCQDNKVCHRLPLRTSCKNGAKSQVVSRWMVKDGQCCRYPWGYCRGDLVMDEPAIRKKKACECQCLNNC